MITLLIILILCVLAVLFHRVWTNISHKRKRAAGKNPYVEGIAHLLDGEYSSALASFREAVRQEPQNADAYLRLGDAMRETGDLARATQVHRELTVRTSMPKHAMARVLLSLARDYRKAKRLDRAAASYEQVLEIKPRDERAMDELLEVYEEIGEWDKAYLIRRDISKLKRVDDTHALALYKAYVGKSYLDRQNLKEAESSLKDALKIDSECAAAYLYLGDVYYALGNIDDAISSWRRIVTVFPAIAYTTFRRLEKAFYEKGRFEKIVDLYNDVLERNPSDVRTTMTLANIHRKKGNIEEALRLCKAALEAEPGSRRVKQALARLYYERGDIELSLKAMVEAFNGFSSDEESHLCSNCNHKANEVLWRCPRCKQWETFV
ncbi:MAG: tetratricopeptide repeat protein [Candidatus Eisenbacteria bacterium]